MRNASVDINHARNRLLRFALVRGLLGTRRMSAVSVWSRVTWVDTGDERELFCAVSG